MVCYQAPRKASNCEQGLYLKPQLARRMTFDLCGACLTPLLHLIG